MIDTSSNPRNIDEYIETFDSKTRKILVNIRKTIRTEAPRADESISYRIPTFKLNGKVLIYFAAFKNHVSIYPAPRTDEEFAAELSSYKGGKGTVQFPLDRPVPYDLIKRIVAFRKAGVE